MAMDGMQDVINKMTERLETLGAAMERITQLEGALTESNASLKQLTEDSKSMATQRNVWFWRITLFLAGKRNRTNST